MPTAKKKQDRFTIVRSEDDPEMTEPDLRAVNCRCGWRSIWVRAGTLMGDDGQPGQTLTADEHAQLMVAALHQSDRHANH
jgi:hypothetical protein